MAYIIMEACGLQRVLHLRGDGQHPVWDTFDPTCEERSMPLRLDLRESCQSELCRHLYTYSNDEACQMECCKPRRDGP